MRNSSWIVCRAFLDKLPSAKQEALLRHLSDADRKMVSGLPRTAGNPAAGVPSAGASIGQIHFSWLGPLFRNMPQREITLFLSALGDPQAAEVKKLLRSMNGRIALSAPALSFLQETIWRRLTSDAADLLPAAFLPQSPLNALLDLKTADLHALIDFLGLHDLAVELKQVIDTGRLKKIYALLSEDEKNYLRILMQSREPVTFTRIGIASWQGDGESLKAAVRQRGMNRFAKALYGQDPSLIWHVTRKMEIDRAMLLQKLCAPMDNVTASKVLMSQVLELLTFMRNPHE